MNKLALIVLLASVCLARANPIVVESDDVELESQSAAAPTDAEETANLQGDSVIFSDFCIRTRDHVLTDIKSTANSGAARLFTLLFNTAQEIGSEALATQIKATTLLGNQIQKPETRVEGEYTGEADNIIAEGQLKIQQDPGQPKSFFQAFVSVIKATGTAIARAVAARMESISSLNGLDMTAAALENACDRFTEYQQEFAKTFEETKSELAASNPKLASLTLGQVNCVTSRRVLRIEGICKFARVAKGPVMSMLSLRSK